MIDRTPITDSGAWRGCPAYARALNEDVDWTDGSDGDTDAPTGYFALYLASDDNPPCVIRTDSNGFNTVVELESDRAAQALYDALEDAYVRWSCPIYDVAFLQGDDATRALAEIDQSGVEEWIDAYAEEYRAGLDIESAYRYGDDDMPLDWHGDYAVDIDWQRGTLALYARDNQADTRWFADVVNAADGVVSVD